MAKEILKIRIDNGLGGNNPTFKDIELDDYSGKFPRMGFPELTATLMWPTPLDDEWTHKEYVVLRGEKFYVTDTPDAEKTNDKIPYKHDLGFTSEFARILGNTFFEDAVPSYSETYDKPCSNSSKFTFYGTISEFCDRLNCSFIKAGIADSVLKTKTSLTTSDIPVGDGYCVMLDPYGEGNVYDPNKSYEFSWEDKSHWEAITEGFNITEIPFERRGKCVIFGAIPKVVDHKFEYGHDNELLSVKHKNAKAKVINRITMLGSSENIPHYYPNETEYGHISIATKSDNNVLRDSNVKIINMTQLLSRLNADSFAVLGKYDGVDVGDANVEQYLYSYAFDNGSFYNYTLGRTEKHNPNGTHNAYGTWHIRAFFKVTQSGYVECRNIRGGVWKQNDAVSTDGADIIEGIKIEALKTVEDKSQGIESIDYTSQVQKNEDCVNLGHLGVGSYFFQFSVRIQNADPARGYGITTFCKLTSIEIEPARKQKTGYYWDVDGKKYDGVGALGVKIVGYKITDAMIGDGFGWEASGRMPFQDHLVPPKYRNTLGTERFYNALNTPYSEEYASEHPDAYIDPDTNNPYAFPNPYIEGAPSEHIFRDDDRKPTIEGVTNASGQLMGVIADIAYDADDNDALKSDSTEDNDKNDTLKYEHSFFYIKLNIFNGQYGFDLFAHASQTDAMTIQMRGGSCNGCKFKIQSAKFTDETGLESYKNPIIVQNGKAVGVVSEDGIKESDLDPAQQNTQTHSIWICVQKDAQTFGRIYPNKGENIKPQIGDRFNIINIDLPQAYILAAEKRLEEDGMRYMLDNNEEKFSFDIQASRIFFAENPDVLTQLDEYSVIKVKYNGRFYEQYVNQLSIECKSKEALLNIGIDLTDTLATGQSFVEQVAERASSLIANPYTMGGATGGSGGGLTTRLADQRYLNKTEADRSKGKVASDVGFEVGEFVSGGSGAILYQDPETGQTYLEVDKIRARMKAIFAELEVAKEQSIGGKFDITPGGGIDISFVEETATSYRCYFKAKDEDKGADCRFIVGDQARCQESNIANGTTQNASNRYYWRLVTAVNNDESYIELSKTDRDHGDDFDSDAPMAGDTIVQLGNRNDPERQSAIVLSTVDDFAPCVTLYNGIDHYSLDGKAVVEYGVDKSKNPPEPFFNCYGRFFFGPKGGNSYLKFEPSVDKLIFSGELVNITSLNGKDIDKYITDLIPEPDLSEYDYLKEAIKDGASVTKGGLYLGGLIMLGQWDTSDEENPVFLKSWSGINGIRNHDKTIATWWGGDMVDKYYNDSVTPRPNPLVDGYAQALIRMDGSGYLAGGNIRWDELGNLILGNGISLGGGSNTIGDVANLFDTVESLTLLFNKFSQGLVPMKLVNGTPTETNWADISSDLSNLYAVKSKKGFYSDEFVSARGANPDGSSGSGATQLRMLDDVLIGNNLASGQSLVYNGTKWVNQKVGLDATELANYLTTNDYAKKSDIPSLTGYATEQWVLNKDYATQQWVEAKGYLTSVAWGDVTGKPTWIGTSKPSYNFSEIGSKPTTIAGYGIIDAKIDGGVITLGANTITPLVSADMKSLTFQSGSFVAKNYTPTSSQTVNIPTTTTHITEGTRLYFTDARAQSALSATVTAINAAIALKLDKSTFDTFEAKFNKMFALEGNATDGYRIKALYGLYTDQFLSARGANADGGNGSAFGRLDDWSNYNANGTDALSAKLGYGLKTDIANINTRIDNLPTTSVNPYALTIQKNGTTLGTYDGSVAKTINISDVASASVLSGHISDTTIHITSAERTLWNNTATNLSAILGSDTDNVINKYEEIVAFLDTYTEADTLAGLLSNKADKTTKISAGTGLSGGGTLASDRTLSLATSGVTAGTYTKLTVDAYGRATAGSSLVAADIPTLAIGKISGLQTALDSKLNASVFNDLFEKVNIGTSSAPVYAIKAKFGLYTEQFLSARGNNPDGTAGGGLIQNVYKSTDLNKTFSDATLTDTFNAFTIKSINERLKTVEGKNYLDDLGISVTGVGNAVTSVTQSADKKTLTFTKGSTFLTDHQPIRTLTIQKNGTTVDTFTPTASANKTINLTDVASASTLSAHTGNTTVHITANERMAWNGKVDAVAGKGLSANDFTDDLLAKLNGIDDNANNYVHPTATANTIAAANGKVLSAITVNNLGHVTSVSSKSLVAADIPGLDWSKITSGKPTTIAGYGITDAYTKTEADNRYVNVSGDTMTGLLTLNAGAKVVSGQKLVIGDCEITWDSTNGGLHFSKGIYSDGFLSARGANSNGSAGGSAFSLMRTWSASENGNDNTQYALGANLGWELRNGKLNATKAAIEGLLTGNITTHTHSQYLTAITKSQVEAVLTGNITSHTHSQYLTSHQSLANYVTLDGAQTITAMKTFVNGLGIRYSADTSNALGIAWRKTDNSTVIQSIIGHNTTKRIIINPNGSADTWIDAVGKYSLLIGENELTYNTYPILHTNNYATTLDNRYLQKSVYSASDVLAKLLTVDGSGSGLDADLLDGKHNGEVTAKNLTAVTAETVGVAVATAKDNLLNALKGNVFGNVTNIGASLINNWNNDSVTTVSSSVYSVINVTPQYNGDTYGQFMLFHYASYNPKLIGRNNGAWSALRTFAFLDDNVASASKLANTRTIWGQDFNGEGDVTGSLASVTTISMDNCVYAARTDKDIDLGLMVTSDGRSTQFINGTSGNRGIYDATNNRWAFAIATDGNTRLLGGNVGVGRTPAYKLDVNGTTRTTKLVIGSITLEDVGGNLHIDKGVYSDSFVSARGANSSGGASGGGSAFSLMRDWDSAENNRNTQYALGANLGWALYNDKADKTWVEAKGYATTASLGGYAKLQSANNLIHSRNEFTIIPDGFSIDVLWFNYRAGAGTTPASGFNTYAFGDGTKGGFASLKANGFIKSGGTSTQVLMADGSVQSHYKAANVVTATSDDGMITPLAMNKWTSKTFLKLSGGTMANTNVVTNLNADLLDGLHSSAFLLAGANAVSASKLANTRTIWGQDFNGEGDVTGSLASVTTISMDNCVYAARTDKDIDLGLMVTSDGRSTQFINGTSGNRGIYDATNNRWAFAIATDGNTRLLGGNVGVGCSPVFKLDVNGIIRAQSELLFGGGEFPFGIYASSDLLYIESQYNDEYNDIFYINGTNGNVWMQGEAYAAKGRFGTNTNSYALNTASFICDSWVRTKGTTGWYSETYGGGWYMTDSNWVRTYNSKGIYAGSGTIRTDGQLQCGSDGARFLVDSNGSVSFGSASTVDGFVLSRRHMLVANANLHFSETNDGSGKGYHMACANNGILYFMTNEDRVYKSTTAKFDTDGSFWVRTGIYSDGYVSARGQNTSSDSRLKRNLNAFEIALNQIADAPSVGFEWMDGSHDVGSIAQYWQEVNPLLTPRGADGYLTLQYGKTALLGLITVAKTVKSHDGRIAELERENEELKRKIEILERR